MVVGSLASLAAGTAVAFLWFGNTIDPDFLEQTAVPVASAGGVAGLTVEGLDCVPTFQTWHRPGLFGRWQQTHYNGRRDVVPWYSLRTRTYFGDLDCSLDDAITLQVPVDIGEGVVAACTVDHRCVQVIVAPPD